MLYVLESGVGCTDESYCEINAKETFEISGVSISNSSLSFLDNSVTVKVAGGVLVICS